MPKALARLTNCYVPVLLEEEEAEEATDEQATSSSSAATSIRPIHIHALSSKNSNSWIVECGETQILCELHAPLAPHKVPSEALPLPLDEGLLLVAVQYSATALNPQTVLGQASTSLDAQGAIPQQQQRVLNQHKEHLQTTLAQTLQSAIQPAIPLKDLPQSYVISLQFTILKDDGGVLSACTAAASLALAHAGIPMLDVVTAVQVAIMKRPTESSTTDNHSNKTTDDLFSLWLDPSHKELSQCLGSLEWAYMPNRKWVTVWQQHSSHSSTNVTHTSMIGDAGSMLIIPPSITTQALALAKQACGQVWLPQLRTYMMQMDNEDENDQ